MEKVWGIPQGTPNHTLRTAFLVPFPPTSLPLRVWYLIECNAMSLQPSSFLSLSLSVCSVKDRIESDKLTSLLPRHCCYAANEFKIPGAVRMVSNPLTQRCLPDSIQRHVAGSPHTDFFNSQYYSTAGSMVG